MPSLTLTDLKTILRAVAGEDEAISLDGDILDTPFTDLGYDSLALLETAGRITRDYGVALSEEDVDNSETPRSLLDRINQALARA